MQPRFAKVEPSQANQVLPLGKFSREKRTVSNLIYLGLQEGDTTWEIITEGWRRQGLGIKLQRRSVLMKLADETKLRDFQGKRDIVKEAIRDLEETEIG